MGKLFKRVRKEDPRWQEAPWQIRYRGPTGRWLDESTHTSDERKALKQMARREAAVADGKYSSGGRKRFSVLAEDWLKLHSEVMLRSHRENVRNYNKHLKPAFGSLALRHIMPSAIREFASEKQRGGLSPATTRRLLALLRVILNHAVAAGALGESPFRRIDRRQLPKEPRVRDYNWFSVEEIAKLLEAAEPRERPFYEAAVYTGLRRGELCGLRWTDVDLDARLINVRRSGEDDPTKSGEPRKVKIPAKLIPTLAAWRANCPPSAGGYAFPNRTGGIRDGAAVSHRFSELCDSAGVRKLPFHSLRHSYATHYMRAGGDLYKLKAQLGHSSIALTERYAHHAPDFAQEDVDRLDFAPKPSKVIGLDEARRRRQGGRRKRSQVGEGVGKRVGIGVSGGGGAS